MTAGEVAEDGPHSGPIGAFGFHERIRPGDSPGFAGTPSAAPAGRRRLTGRINRYRKVGQCEPAMISPGLPQGRMA